MADADPFSELAVGLSADHKAEKATRVKTNATPRADEDPKAGEHEEEISLATARLESIVDDSEFDTATLVGDLRDCMIDIIKSRPKPWSQLSNAEQHDVARAVEYAAKVMVGRAVDLIVANSKDDPIKAILEGYAEKDGIKATLKIKTMSEEDALAAVAGLHKARGGMVLISKASVDDYSGERREVTTDPDQPDLTFEGDDSDLAGED